MSARLARRRLLAGALLAAAPRGAWAQPAAKLPRIAYMSFGPVARNALAGSHDGFLAGLRDLGYVPGRSVSIEYRHAGGRAENLPQTAREVLDLHPDVVLAVGVKDIDALLKLSQTVPIVTVYAPDLVGLGYAESLARPGRNVTGVTTLAGDLTVKWLEILKEIRPGLTRVGALWDVGMGPPEMMDVASWRPESAFRATGIRRVAMPVLEGRDLEPAFDTARRDGVGAVMLGPSSSVLRSELARIAELAIKHRWPSIADLPAYAEGGLLLAYGAEMHDLFRRAASHVAKILRGARPGDIPVEQPTKFSFVANLKTARALDLTLPPALLLRADRTIE